MGSHVSGLVRLRIAFGRLMRRRRPGAANILLIPLGAVACSCASEAPRDHRDGVGGLAFTDAAGIEHVFEGPARRVVSLVPSATQMLRALGANEFVVGRTDFDTDPWALGLPSVGGGLAPSLEAIVALRPDLVIRFAGEQDPRTAQRLDDLGIRHLAVRPDHIDDIYEMLQLLATATGTSAAADSLELEIRSGLEDVRSSIDHMPRLRVAYVLGGSPPLVAGAGTYIGEIMDLLGGDNAFADLDPLYSAVSPEEFRARDIDVILMSEGTDFNHALAPNARIESVETGFEVPGPDIVRAARSIARALHGGP